MKNKHIEIVATFVIVILVVVGISLYLQNWNDKSDQDSEEGINNVAEVNETSETTDIPIQTKVVLDGLEHIPAGLNNIYGSQEVKAVLWDRNPRDPVEGDTIKLSAAAWPIKGDYEVWISWELNGETQPTVACKHTMDDGEKAIWKGTLGSFEQGDIIKYTFHAGLEGVSQIATEEFSCTVLGWETLTNIDTVNELGGMLELIGSSSSTLKPSLYLSFPEEGTVHLQCEPLNKKKVDITSQNYDTTQNDDITQNDDATQNVDTAHIGDISLMSYDSDRYNYEVEENDKEILVSNDKVTVHIGKKPFSFEVYSAEQELLFSDTKSGEVLRFLTDGKDIVQTIDFQYASPAEEEFYGFGMKYDELNHRGKNVDTYTVNWYTEQDEKSYSPIPYYYVPNKYGMFINSTYYSQFRLATDDTESCTLNLSTGGNVNTGLDLYLYFGNNDEIIKSYTSIIGKPVLPSVWAFGPWISANEWNRQSEVIDQVNKSIELEIPTTTIVIEAWSDEETFYTFNDSAFEAALGDYMPSYSDFTFKRRWPDPKGMTEYIHENNMKVLLWQIPVLKRSGTPTAQSILDQQYAEDQGYVLKYDNGEVYRMPDGWFGGSTLIDFTSEEATNWFLGKRKYLLEEVGIDGFKTDGGEFVWGRNVLAADGKKGDELRNSYPDLYAKAYFDFARKIVPDAITFSRAGGTFLGAHPVAWVGDQKSDFESFQAAIRATLSLSMSGIPFVAWDIAGFSGDIPTSQLYQRSVAQAAFSPIMQVHSEQSGDPEKSQARTPWNMAERTGDEECLNVYRYYANMRMNLLPYIYNAAYNTSLTGIPLIRSMAYAFPGEASAQEFQYLFGDSLLVAPVTTPEALEQKVYLPKGGWYDLFTGKYHQGGTTVVCTAKMDEIPVFVKAGSIIPLNLNNKLELGGNIGNETDKYNRLSFRIYPKGKSDYRWYDYVKGKEYNISADSSKDHRGLTIDIDKMEVPVTLEVYQKQPGKIIVNGKPLQNVTTKELITEERFGWCYDKDRGSVLISLDTKNPTSISLIEAADNK